VDLILQGGDCRVGLESTILSLIDDSPVLLRPGALSPAELEAVIGRPIASLGQPTDVRAPGTLESHYAPNTRLLICPTAALEQQFDACLAQGFCVAVMHYSAVGEALSRHSRVHSQPMSNDARAYGQALYATLRALDLKGFDMIVVEAPPRNEAWRAVNDRLDRASHGSRQ
jgi:L-threonylcarbamoyladenylate synthase